MLIPEYAKNIITAVVAHQTFTWYVTSLEDEYWYLDFAKRLADWNAAGFNVVLDEHDARHGYEILDSGNILAFQQEIAHLSTSTDELRIGMVPAKAVDSEWYYDWSPSLYIDFDQKWLCSQYREVQRFDDYLPEQWTSSHEEFLSRIPPAARYWVVDGVEHQFV
jgi:hypothetical protein